MDRPEGKRKKRGLAGMSLEKRRAIASKGGKASHTSHKWTSEEAREAGRKGGISRQLQVKQGKKDV